MKIGVPVEEDVISSHAVTSWFECGNKCLENQECIAFSHLDEHSDRGINCKLAKNTGDIVVVRGNDAWTTYGIRSNGLVRLTIRIFLHLSYANSYSLYSCPACAKTKIQTIKVCEYLKRFLSIHKLNHKF